MGHLVGLNDIHLICKADSDCNTKILNSYCNSNSTCICERGYKYYSKFNKCIFSNHFHCSNPQQCANLDPRLTCNDNYCTCKEKEKRIDSYLCSSFRKYCYKGYRYNVETTDCVFVGDLNIAQLENLDQSVEIFVIVLFFITSALFIASCINNYKNERAEKLRRRLAQQQTMSLFAEQRRRMELSPSTTEVSVSLPNNDDFYSNNQLRNGASRHTNRMQTRFYRHSNLDEQLKTNSTDDLPPSYEELFGKNEENSKFFLNPLNLLATNLQQQQVNFVTIENDHQQQAQIDDCLNCSSNMCNNLNHNLDNNLNNNLDNNLDNSSNDNNSTNLNNVNNNVNDNCHINDADNNNNMQPINNSSLTAK